MSNIRDCAVRPLLRHCFVQAKWLTLAWFICINKRHSAVESPSYMYRSSANWNCVGMYVSTGWITVEKKPGKTGKHWCDRYDARSRCLSLRMKMLYQQGWGTGIYMSTIRLQVAQLIFWCSVYLLCVMFCVRYVSIWVHDGAFSPNWAKLYKRRQCKPFRLVQKNYQFILWLVNCNLFTLRPSDQKRKRESYSDHFIVLLVSHF